MVIGRKSTLFLVYGYELPLTSVGGDKIGGEWKQHTIKGAALLPHLDEYVRRGELLRAYETSGDLRSAFSARSRSPWERSSAAVRAKSSAG